MSRPNVQKILYKIETKGGEAHGQDKNIDKQIENKFYTFKQYAERKNINRGFVRDKDGELYINNTEFSEDMVDESWVEISQIF